jgi:hypothetical protein
MIIPLVIIIIDNYFPFGIFSIVFCGFLTYIFVSNHKNSIGIKTSDKINEMKLSNQNLKPLGHEDVIHNQIPNEVTKGFINLIIIQIKNQILPWNKFLIVYLIFKK